MSATRPDETKRDDEEIIGWKVPTHGDVENPDAVRQVLEIHDYKILSADPESKEGMFRERDRLIGMLALAKNNADKKGLLADIAQLDEKIVAVRGKVPQEESPEKRD